MTQYEFYRDVLVIDGKVQCVLVDTSGTPSTKVDNQKNFFDDIQLDSLGRLKITTKN